MQLRSFLSLPVMTIVFQLVIMQCQGYDETEIGGSDKRIPRLNHEKSQKSSLSKKQIEVAQEKPGDVQQNPWLKTADHAASTFSIDVDTAAYTLMRSALNKNKLPAMTHVRPEEYINFFRYGYAMPSDDGNVPFKSVVTLVSSPFNEGQHLLRIGIQGKKLEAEKRQKANLVFLVDVSGSMSWDDKLGRVKTSLLTLLENLRADDRIAIVTYAGASQVVLPSTSIDNKGVIISAINALGAGGGTNMGNGMTLAYQEALRHHGNGVLSRVIVCSDGDANIGAKSYEEMLQAISDYVRQGIGMTTLGFGNDAYNDTMMEQLADNGNGNYYFIDSDQEAKRILGTQLTGTLAVIAKDVKIQVRFDANSIASYRLIGYENRVMENQDFQNDAKDAGEMGAGHQVTALYELTFQEKTQDNKEAHYLDLAIRYKNPQGDNSHEIVSAVDHAQGILSFADSDGDLQFATAVAAFAGKLGQRDFANTVDYADILDWSAAHIGDDATRKEFKLMVEKASRIKR